MSYIYRHVDTTSGQLIVTFPLVGLLYDIDRPIDLQSQTIDTLLSFPLVKLQYIFQVKLGNDAFSPSGTA